MIRHLPVHRRLHFFLLVLSTLTIGTPSKLLRCDAQVYGFGTYSFAFSSFTGVNGFSIQTFTSGNPQTHQFTLADFSASPPLPAGSTVSLIYTAQGWSAQSVSTSGVYQSAAGKVYDQATLTVSSDGTYTLQRHRSGAVFGFLPGYSGHLDDTLTIDLISGKGVQNTSGSATDMPGD